MKPTQIIILVLAIASLLMGMVVPKVTEGGLIGKLNAILSGPISEGRFGDALTKLNALRHEAVATHYIDGLRGYCECELGNPAGRNLLYYAIANSQDPAFKSEMKLALKTCDIADHRSLGSVPTGGSLRVSNGGGRTLRSSGKGYNPMGRIDEVEEIYLIDEMSFSELESRLTRDITEAEASAKAADWLGVRSVEVHVSDHFVVVGVEGYQLQQLQAAGEELEDLLYHHLEYYELEAPPYLIWVYPQPEQSTLKKMAGKLHGLSLGKSNIGYSVLEDLSICALDPNLNLLTLGHELVHILLNYNAPFLPPWIGEGLPSLYETVSWDRDDLIAHRNWRSDLLDMQISRGGEIPSLKALLLMDWDEFDGYEQRAPKRPEKEKAIQQQLSTSLDDRPTVVRGITTTPVTGKIDGRKQHLQHAMAREFMLYLYEEDALDLVIMDQIAVFTGEVSSGRLQSSVEVLEASLEMPIAEIEEDFSEVGASPVIEGRGEAGTWKFLGEAFFLPGKRRIFSSMTYDEIIAHLHQLSDPKRVLFKQVKYGIVAQNALGVYLKDINEMARSIRRDSDLALRLWDSGIYEARLLCPKVYAHRDLNESRMEEWVAAFDNWEICDAFCMGLFAKSHLAEPMMRKWMVREAEFEKRAGFATLAAYCMANKTAPNEAFTQYFPFIRQAATDQRNFVKKAVSWALRNIGKRNRDLLQAAIAEAEAILEMDSPSAKWVARDVLRELQKEGVRVSDYPRKIYRPA